LAIFDAPPAIEYWRVVAGAPMGRYSDNIGNRRKCSAEIPGTSLSATCGVGRAEPRQATPMICMVL